MPRERREIFLIGTGTLGESLALPRTKVLRHPALQRHQRHESWRVDADHVADNIEVSKDFVMARYVSTSCVRLVDERSLQYLRSQAIG